MKAPAMMAMLDEMSTAVFGRSLSESVASGICISCGKEKGEFRDTVSQVEYTLTGMCQACQDDFFATFAEDD